VRVLFERPPVGPRGDVGHRGALAWYAGPPRRIRGLAHRGANFYARGEAATAVRWGIVSIVANVVAAVLLIGRPLGHAGLAGAASFGAY